MPVRMKAVLIHSAIGIPRGFAWTVWEIITRGVERGCLLSAAVSKEGCVQKVVFRPEERMRSNIRRTKITKRVVLRRRHIRGRKILKGDKNRQAGWNPHNVTWMPLGCSPLLPVCSVPPACVSPLPS